MEGYQWGEERENGGKGTENKKHNCQVQNRQGDVKNSTGNREATELICTTHGHELRGWGSAGGTARQRGEKQEKKIGTIVIA